MGAKIISKTEIVIETQYGEEVLKKHRVNINLSCSNIIQYSIKADLASFDPDIKWIQNWPDPWPHNAQRNTSKPIHW